MDPTDPAAPSGAEWPLHGLADDVRPALARALAEGPTVLATIVALEGGGPRPVGTQMLFGQGFASGFLSGGCIEGDVEIHAQEVLETGRPKRLVYGEGSPWPDIRLLCGARVEILVEHLDSDDAAARDLLTHATQRRPALWFSDGIRRVCAPAGATPVVWPGVFVRRFDPVSRLVVMGGDPTALALASLGAQAGFETTLVRPKGPLAAPPLAGVAYSRAAPAEALAAIGLDAWTAVAVCSHDMTLDHQALLAALPSRCSYVGLLGARRRLAERLAALRASGLTERDLVKLRAPIGLDLGGKAPFEVAIAVIGEIIATRHGQPALERRAEVAF
ncbi:XdhC family protein [Caulobacter hibisci]|uniref:XdhC family protein n=1 Tax=Caulobacter hibisci TaxID=2035993 RepID=A0ABS0T1P3_9CAUL|nr:XdhC family protein [Caulobacter hibisci]MBI1684838.1 XdhC family protein [Caulobacter hibisci]